MPVARIFIIFVARIYRNPQGMIKKHHILYGLIAGSLLLLTGCHSREAKEQSNQKPPIFPDYVNVTIPPNLSPVNFRINGADRVTATFSVSKELLMEVSGDDHIEIPIDKWRDMLTRHKGQDISVAVSAWTREKPDGISYAPFSIHIDTNPIDSFVAYRLIPPGYEEWNKMGIYERNLTSFEQTPIVVNNQNNHGCVNCHSFADYHPERMLFHARGRGGGTVITNGKDLKKVDLASMGPMKSGTYPMWHPSGNYIALSSNVTRQSFYTHCHDKIEVYDLSSDLIVYDVRKNDVLADNRFNDSINWETFPAFSPDGKWLYFCTAKAVRMPTQVKSLHYSLVRVPFNEANGSLGAPVDTVYSSWKQGGSVSFPRISPDGKYLLFTWSDCSTFPIQHKEADLKLIDLTTKTVSDATELNSPETDSYHSWSHDGKWLIFSSRRIDGRYTRLFIAPFRNGKFGKPFLLPQKDPNMYDNLLDSYNIPEFVRGKVEIPKDKLAELFKVE